MIIAEGGGYKVTKKLRHETDYYHVSIGDDWPEWVLTEVDLLRLANVLAEAKRVVEMGILSPNKNASSPTQEAEAPQDGLIRFGDLYDNDTRFCKCNHCNAEFAESEILVDKVTDIEYCPNCRKAGAIMDMELGE